MHWRVTIEAIDPTGDTYKRTFQFEKDLGELSEGHVGCSIEQGETIMAEIQKAVVKREVPSGLHTAAFAILVQARCLSKTIKPDPF